MKKLIALLICLLLLPTGVVAESTEEPELTAAEILRDYTRLDITPHAGKTVVLNFFTEWCYYCMQEMPDLKAVNDLYSPDDFQMILIHVWDGEDASNTENVKAKYGMEHMTFFEDEDRTLAGVVGLAGYPCTLVIDPEGNLAGRADGMISLESLTGALDEMGVERVAEESK